jgi:Txe/YoeB family toxin of toxin-antitoxin system
VTWAAVYSKQAQKDSKKIAEAELKEKTINLISILSKDPFQNQPPYEELIGDLAGAYSRRINIQHRLVYQIFEKERIVRILRMWTHYE